MSEHLAAGQRHRAEDVIAVSVGEGQTIGREAAIADERSHGRAFFGVVAAVDGQGGSMADDDRVLALNEVMRDAEDTRRHLFEFYHARRYLR